MPSTRRVARYLSLAVAGLTLVLAIWTVVPAPTMLLYPLAVGAPEVSLWLSVVALVACVGAASRRERDATRTITLLVAGGAFALAVHPLVRFPATARRFDAAMTDVLGNLASDARAPDPRRLYAGQVLTTLLRGVPEPEVRVAHRITVAAHGETTLTAEIYQPPVSMFGGANPVLIQVYGGAWQRGAPGDNAAFARHLAGRGYVVVAIDYRHAPRWKWPVQLEDVRAAIRWTHEHAREYGGDTTRIALIGRSSGAHLALLAAYTSPSPTIRAVVDYYGPVDLTDGYRNPPRPDPLGVRAVEEAFLGGGPDQLPQRYVDASPITHVTAGLPPTLLVYGRRDHIVEARFGRLLRDSLRAAGNTAVLLEIPWAEHAFDAVPNGPSAQLALYHTERFLAWAFARASGTSR